MAGAAWLLYAVWRSAHRADLATYGAFAVGVVTVVAGCVTWARRAGTSATAKAAAGQDLDGVADLLAVAVRSQWERVAGERGLVGRADPGDLGQAVAAAGRAR